jgi:RND family efflux transporter MFP subunit
VDLDPRDALSALKIDREHPEEGHAEGWRPTPRQWQVGLAALVLVFLGAIAVWWWARPQAVAVHTIIVASGSDAGGAALNASGYVVAQQEATVAAEITGMVTAVYVNEGERVQAGQILARLDDSAARATVNAAESQLVADRALPPEFQAQLLRDRRTLERTRALIKADAVSQTNLDTAVAAVGVDEAELAHAVGQVSVDAKTLAYDNTQLSYTVIRAPFTGVVTERYAHPGEMISPQAVGGFTQTGICKVVDMQSLEIDVDVNEAYVQRVHAGQTVEAVLDAYPDWPIAAHVIGVVPTANEQKATVKVRIAFDKLDPRILPQMAVQVRFMTAAGPIVAPVIRVPATALHRENGGEFLYVLEDGHAKRRAVVARSTPSGEAIVRSGLDGGERVIVSADGALKDGDEVHEP